MSILAVARARSDTATLAGHQTKIELCDLVKNSWQISTPVTRRQTTSLIGLKRSTRFERTIRNVFPAPGIPETWVNVSEDRIYTTRLHLQMPGRKKTGLHIRGNGIIADDNKRYHGPGNVGDHDTLHRAACRMQEQIIRENKHTVGVTRDEYALWARLHESVALATARFARLSEFRGEFL